jgi:hypothetical protein
MCRSLLKRPELSNEDAERILDHLYSLADVAVEAFIERPSRPEMDNPIEGAPVAALSQDKLTSPAA